MEWGRHDTASITGSTTFTNILGRDRDIGQAVRRMDEDLFPDVPARRYPELSGEIKEICQRYYTGPLH